MTRAVIRGNLTMDSPKVGVLAKGETVIAR
jgi:hypothetical protein